MSPAVSHLKRVVWKLYYALVAVLPVRAVNHLPFGRATKDDRWAIGICEGTSPLSLAAPNNLANPVLSRRDVSDVKAKFVADPFMVWHESMWYMFFEVFNLVTRKGEIALATSDDGRQWRYQRVVLREPFHLSYPHVFQWNGTYYLIPESHYVREVRLYQAKKFPTDWEHKATLLNGAYYADASVFRHNDQWFMFVEGAAQAQFDTLRLYMADDLLGPWKEHPKSPVVRGNPRAARPAGKIVSWENRLLRFAQDCSEEYGARVIACEITELTATAYQECEIKVILEPDGAGWNSRGMHHVDAHEISGGRWIACVDGRC